MSEIKNVPYQSVGYNANELAPLSFDQVKKEVAHHFKNDPKADEKIKELHELCKKACPSDNPVADKPASAPIAEKPAPALSSVPSQENGGK